MFVEARLHLDCNARQSLTSESHRERLGRDNVLLILPLKRFCILKATNLINKGYTQSALKTFSVAMLPSVPAIPHNAKRLTVSPTFPIQLKYLY